MPSVLITGANRGIGLEFARQYAADGWRVFATCRDPDAAGELRAVSGDISVHRLNVIDAGQIAALAGELAGEAIDLLINNAGISGRGGSAFGRIDYGVWEDTMRVNALAPALVTEAFAPHLERGDRKCVVAISSRLGSISEMGGGYLIYGTSKAALNAAMKTLAADLRGRGITVAVLHPGWVATDMGGAGAPVSAEASVAAMRGIIAGLGPSDSGRFFDYGGDEIPW